MAKRVVFRTDGGNVYSVGMGHVYRCLRLARILYGFGIESSFVMLNYPEGIRLVKSEGYHVEVLDQSDGFENAADQTVKFAGKVKALLFVDLRTSKQYLVERASLDGIPSIIYEDTHWEATTPTCLINPSVYSANSEIYDLTSSETQFYFGIDYVVIDPILAAYQKTSFSPEIRTLLLTFGGADPCNLSSRILDLILSKTNVSYHIQLILGPAFKHHDQVDEVIQKHHARCGVTINRNVRLLASFQSACDGAITAGGTTVYESIALRLPCLALPTIDTEADMIGPLIESGLIYGVKRDVTQLDDETLTKIIRSFLGDELLRERLFEFQGKVDIQNGIVNVISIIQQYLN